MGLHAGIIGIPGLGCRKVRGCYPKDGESNGTLWMHRDIGKLPPIMRNLMTKWNSKGATAVRVR